MNAPESTIIFMAKTDMTRRQLAAALVAIPAAAAQTTEAPKDDLAIQRENVKRNLTLLDNFKVPTATEPSLIFKP